LFLGGRPAELIEGDVEPLVDAGVQRIVGVADLDESKRFG
jgi:hypothetical protein